MGHILFCVNADTMEFLPSCFSVANVIDNVAVGSPVLLEFLIPEVLYRVSTEMLMFLSSPLACSSFHSCHQSSAGQFCQERSCSFAAFHSQRLETSQGQQAESAAS